MYLSSQSSSDQICNIAIWLKILRGKSKFDLLEWLNGQRYTCNNGNDSAKVSWEYCRPGIVESCLCCTPLSSSNCSCATKYYWITPGFCEGFPLFG